MERRFAVAELRREFRAAHEGPVTCIRVHLEYAATTPDPRSVVAPFELVGDHCAVYFRAENGRRDSPLQAIADAREAVRRLPMLPKAWMSYARSLSSAGRTSDARAAFFEGAGHMVHPLDRAMLLAAFVGWSIESGDTAGAVTLDRALQVAIARDGRVGLRFGYLGRANWPPPVGPPAGATDVLERFRYWERLRLARSAASPLAEWEALRDLCHALVDAGQPLRAIELHDRLVAIADGERAPGLQLISYTMRGRAFAKLGRLREAERDLRQAIAIGAGVEPHYYPADAWHNLAHMYEGDGRLADASRAADRFVAITRPLHNAIRITSLHDAALIRWRAGWHAAALAAFAEMARAVDDLDTEHYWAGEYYERIGNLGDALRNYRRGVRLGEEIENLRGLARVHEALGNADSAEAAAREHDRRTIEWSALELPLYPDILARRGQIDRAVRIADAWSARQVAGGNVQAAALAALNTARLLLAAGAPVRALDESIRAESLAAALNLTDELIEARRLRGISLHRIGRKAEGLRLLEGAARQASAHPTADGLLRTHVSLGDALADVRPRAALVAYDRAAVIVESSAGALSGDVGRAGYRQVHLAPFDGAVRALLRMPAPDLAVLFRWSQRRKGAALALATSGVSAAPPPGITLAAAQERLRPGEAVVDYIVLDTFSAAMVLTRERAVLVRLGVGGDSLAPLVERLRRPLGAAFAGRLDLARAEWNLDLAGLLYRELLQPLAAALGSARRLVIVPDGALHTLPFAALVVRREGANGVVFAIDELDIAYALSTRWMRPGAVPGGSRLLVVRRDVPGGAREETVLRSVWSAERTTVLSLASASETATRAAMARHGIIHLAVHATADARDPLASHLQLESDSLADGLLHLGEIAGIRTPARLVVLSACETQAGRLYRGEGVLSLARAFLAGGAGEVVATQWPVGERTADLMGEFYSGLWRGQPVSVALRHAQLALRGDPHTSHPFYWAGLVLVRP